MKVILGGDTHGDRNQVRWLLQQAEKHEAAGVFVLGDFGVWDHLDAGAFTNGVAVDAKRMGLKVWFLPGNHENYDILEDLEDHRPRDEDGFVVYHEGMDTLLYSPRAHRWTWDGVKFLSLGGAYSVDKKPRTDSDAIALIKASAKVDREHHPNARERALLRTLRESWWPQEEITFPERDQAMMGGVVDVMLAHDKPRQAQVPWNRKDIRACEPNQDKLQTVVDAVQPRLYTHGHFHYAYRTSVGMTRVVGLDCDPEASRGTGGSGKRSQSWALLELHPTRVKLTTPTGRDGTDVVEVFPVGAEEEEGDDD